MQTDRAGHRAVVWGCLGMALVIVLGVGLSQVVIGPSTAHALVGKRAPDITSSTWINSAPQSLASLRGKVVLVEFWTFGCYNCRNVEPKIKEWHARYAEEGLVVIGIHSPEFAFERDVDTVRRYMEEHHIRYAVALDNDFANWKRFGNRYWPAMYLIDKRGIVRYLRIGEGGYQATDHAIRSLLAEPS